MNVVPQPFFEAGVTAPSVNLCITGDPGADRVADVVVLMLPAKLPCKFGPLRTRAHQAHIAAQDIPQLRQFVQTQAPQIVSDPRAARVAGNRPDGAEVALGIFVHGPELDDGEAAPVETDTDLPVEDGAAVGEPDCNGNDGEKR